ncbi:DUF4350 domain-containing protein [Nocardioides bruguierae]|uniref:DUF4350 domain-containing protein n=1 Tax=Nocardioides bruguierae TaxID=2945102 RepID=A0A9X2D6D5_9ACTN|nr:DUF4350 domain-containing protein [Nocardioides bruguierae]MCM0619895.1 DUF4350 domain-containing protein [Nocardioides bruguierae]
MRRARPLLVLLAVVAGLVALTVALVPAPTPSAALDPENPAPDGARALARVLAAQGVEVDVARGADALEGALSGGGPATVLVTSSWALSPSTAAALLSSAGEGELVVAGAGPLTVSALGLDVAARSVGERRDVPARCDDPVLAGALDGLVVSSTDAYAYDAPGCFGRGRALVTRTSEATLLGATGVLRNDQVLDADNAAVALRLLGARDRLVWYVPDPADALPSEAGALAELPDALAPGLWLTLLVVVAVAVWRGRRLGPLVSEPLPVVVRSSETTLARGRLYHRAGDAPHAAAALRAGSRGRLADHLGVPPGPAAGEPLVLAVASAAGRDEAEVRALLAPEPAAGARPVDDDRALTRLATDLDRLEHDAGVPAPATTTPTTTPPTDERDPR